ncbi:MAG: hypothetical protein NZM28_00040, partial [Fimbriimonadales bacterium]|nr:hypothetical protein [Fimbriimonadales bacterium]
MLLHTDYLGVSEPHAGAVFIPLAELPHRTHELPPPHREIRLTCDSVDAYYALGWLHARGRRARLAEPPTSAAPNARYRLWQPNEWLEAALRSTGVPPAPTAQERDAPATPCCTPAPTAQERDAPATPCCTPAPEIPRSARND